MGVPLQNPFNPLEFKADSARTSQPDRGDAHAIAGRQAAVSADDDDLQRLQSSVQWMKSELVIAAREAGAGTKSAGTKNHRRRLPRASQLPPVPGISPVGAEPADAAPSRAALRLELAPPQACERLPAPARKDVRAYRSRRAVGILIAGVVAGSIAYHVSTWEFFAASGPAQAAASDPIMAVGIANRLR